jgi:hypothetical protein
LASHYTTVVSRLRHDVVDGVLEDDALGWEVEEVLTVD